MLFRRMGVLLSLLGVLAFSACGTSTDRPDDGKVSVVAAFYPLQYVAEQIGGDRVRVQTLVKPGASGHDLELTPQQIAALQEADLVIYQKGLHPAVDRAIADGVRGRTIDVATVVTLLPTAADGNQHEGDQHDHDHGPNDPHQWLNPENMVAMGTAVRDTLAALAPTDAEVFTRANTAFAAAMSDLDQRFQRGLARCERKDFVTSHTAFGYLAKRYGLIQHGIRGVDPDTEPSPQRIAEVQQLARKFRLTTVFYETQVSPVVSESIARDLGLRTDVLDPIESLSTDTSRGSDYLAIMDANLASLRVANGCS